MNKKLLHYISTATSWQIKKIKTYTKESITLPVHIFNKFHIARYRLEKLEVLFLEAKEDSYNPRQLKQYVQLINRNIDMPVIFVFRDCDSTKIQNMIKHKINFIVPNKYIYLPFALMQIETINPLNKITTLPSKLDNISKIILVAYLCGMIKSPVTGAEIAKILGKQPIVISKALHTLEKLEYLSFKKNGRQKIVHFIEKYPMWQRCKHELYTPIKERVYTDSNIESDLFVYSGISALTKETNIAQETIKTVAIYKRNFNRIKNKLHLTDKEEAHYEIEVWNIDPKLLSSDRIVNPLYLVINFLYEEDDRVQIALEELISKHEELAFLKEETYA